MEQDINEIKSTIKSLTNKRKILEDLDSRILEETAEEDVAKEIEGADGYVFDIIKTLCKFETFNQQSNVQSQPTTNQTEFSIILPNFRRKVILICIRCRINMC